MKLEGSCHCGAVRFSVTSRHPAPYQRCYCSICRKCGGGGGFLINTLAEAETLEVVGEQHVKVYRAAIERDGASVRSGHARHFCGECGAHLWAQHDRWPALLHPVAGAIDTELPAPPAVVHMMTGSAASWAAVDVREGDAEFEAYPAQSIAAWHEAHGLAED
ncbi:MAG: GFA family protein [Myxococcota bacterium]